MEFVEKNRSKRIPLFLLTESMHQHKKRPRIETVMILGITYKIGAPRGGN